VDGDDRAGGAGPVIRAGRPGPRHRAPEVADVQARADTLPIAADTAGYGRHAAPPAAVPRPRTRPDGPAGQDPAAPATGADHLDAARHPTVTATIAAPSPDLEAATAKLWLRLREQLTATGRAVPADQHDLVVTGPRESTDAYGRVWFWFRGTVPAPEPARGGTGPRSGGGGTAGEAPCWPVRPVPHARGTGWACTLRSAAEASRVRRSLRVQLQQWSPAGACAQDAADGVLLAFEELTSNAFRHGTGAVGVTIARTAAGWLLVVDDEAPDRPPRPAVGRDPALGGMGLGMVAGLSLQHGWQPHPGRKSVWAELAAPR
jgi:Histidine kinase-like ATPase domain